MPRNQRRPKVKWTEKMVNDALKCKEKALEIVNSSNPQRKPNGRKVGYMEIMLDLWNKEGYENLQFSKQNLSDGINQASKRKHPTYTSLSETVASEREHLINTITTEENTTNIEPIMPEV